MSVAEPSFEEVQLVQPVGRVFVIADLEALPAELPSGPLDYELDDGRLIFVVPPGNLHGAAQLQIATELMIQGERRNHGKARTEVGVIIGRDPDCVLTPDVLFVANKSLPLRTSREGYLETIPDLVVEVRSKNDSLKHIERKVQHYLKAGVQVVWVADWSTSQVTAYTSTDQPAVSSVGDTLQLTGLIPGFSMPVADVFRG
jgi:Uma2 family endonuclease